MVLITILEAKAQNVNIPDANFKNILLLANSYPYGFAKDLNGDFTIIDTNQDGEIQNSEAENILELNVSHKRIDSLIGIEAFVNLTTLNCSRNKLTSLNTSTLTHLKEIDVSRNKITALNIANNLQLEILTCNNNKLTSLNVDTNTNLKILTCNNNKLTSLNVDTNINLNILSCYTNSISTLHLNNNTLLSELYCNSNNISTLDVNDNTSLVKLTCSNNNDISTLNVANNTSLEILNCGSTTISNLDISNNTQLKNLGCGNTNISNLDLSANPLMTTLSFGYTNISTINISNLLDLTFLSFSYSDILTIDVSANTEIRTLHCSGTNITNLDLSNNTQLRSLQCNDLNLTHLDLSNNPNITSLYCRTTNISSLDLTNNTNLIFLDFSSTNITQFNDVTGLTTNIKNIACNANNFTEIDVSNYVNLTHLGCSSNNITTLDLSNNFNLISLSCRDNLSLSYINLKNGNNSNFNSYNIYVTNFTTLPSLETVCIDELNSGLNTKILNDVGHAVTFTEYCSLLPTQNNQISGNVKLDTDSNGCDMTDLNMSNVMLTTNNGTETFATFTQNNGAYLLYTNEGDFTTEATVNLPSYFTVSPNSYANNFTGFNNTFTANFCIEPNQIVNDLNITLLPITVARPNVEATYKIVYKNVGTTVLNGSIDFNYNDNLLDFILATEPFSTQTTGLISFNYANLNPFETRTITVTFNVSIDATIDDNLDFITTINPILNDYSENDNSYRLNQSIVNSYDPNDIHILEGSSIKLQNTDDDLHYLIRFQNTGTAEALNIVVTNELEEKLDWSTLQLEDTSHEVRVAIKNGNKVAFIFENINLPDEGTNEKGSQGYIAYKIKLKNTISVGDIVLNQAQIFFDYNAAIDTNIATTSIIDNTASITDTELLDAVLLYPNPTKGSINIEIKDTIITTVAIYSKLGQLVLSKLDDDINQIDITKLTPGVYFIRLIDNKGNSAIKKFIKEGLD